MGSFKESHFFSTGWKDYELIDFGGGYKLERFGQYVLSRPEPQAIQPKLLEEKEWKRLADAHFERKKDSPEQGNWSVKPSLKDPWYLTYKSLVFKISLSSFKHVGIFPEQMANWDFISKNCSDGDKVLNLFAYTGGASLAARSVGATVTHVDSVKPVLSWAKANMEQSKLTDIRWMAEDAAKFVEKEVRRGNSYNTIILDPPAYGRGPKNEKWILESDLPNLLLNVDKLLKTNGNLILNIYSMGLSPLIAANLLKHYFNPKGEIEYGELGFISSKGMKLPFGSYARFNKK